MCGVSGCRYANISLHMQGSTRSCVASFDHRNIPRERGGHPFIHSEYRYPRIIFPANAGVFPGMHNGRTRVEHIPRERGGLPLFERLTFKVTGYSPANAGVILAWLQLVSREIIFPAHAGVNPIFFLDSACESYIPRARGGLPTVACPGAGMRTLPCVSRDATAFAADLSK